MSARCLPPVHLALVGSALALLITLGLVSPAAGAERPGRLTGTITGDGRALANAWVTLTPVDARGSATGASQWTVTDPSGGYEFTALPGGPLKIHVRAPLLGPFADTFWPDAHSFAGAGILEVAGGTRTADVDLPVAGSVRGRIVDGRTGAPIPGARVTATLAQEPSSGSLGTPGPVEGPGGFALSGLPPVALQLAVTLPAGSPYLATPAGRPSASGALRIDGGARTSGVVIRLPRAAEIRGTVRDDAGAPVAGAGVRVTGCLPSCPPSATSDASGRYRIAGVAPGTGLGVVAVPGEELLGPWYPSRQTTARVTDLAVDEGAVIEAVDLTLPRAAYVTVEVRGPARGDPLRVIVRLTTTGRTYSQYFARPSEGPPAAVGTAGADSPAPSPTRLRVGPVPPGEYSLAVSMGVADAGYLPARWVTDSGTPSTPTIRLTAGEDARAAVGLAGSDPPPREADEGATPADAGGWPGLGRGFLAATTWPVPSSR